jgi:TPR repeat protein
MNYCQGTDFDPAEGTRLLQESATAGNAKAQMTLGCFVLSGLSMPPDRQTALGLFDKAAASIPEAASVAKEVRSRGYDVYNPVGAAVPIVINGRRIGSRRAGDGHNRPLPATA